MASETDFTIYTVVVVHGGLLQDVVTFLDEATAQAYLEGIVVKNEPETVEDTGVELALSENATETRHTYRAPDGRTHEAAVRSDLTDSDDDVYLEVSPLLRQAPTARLEGSTRLRRVGGLVERGDWSAAQRGCRVVGAELDDLADEMLPVSLEEEP